MSKPFKLFSSNSKMKNSVNDKYKKIVNFDIPAFRAPDGTITCPMAGKCASACYAQTSFYKFNSVLKKHQANLDATRSSMFVENAIIELNKNKASLVRIHSSGDFYDLSYFIKWVTIASYMSHITFYAYTKSINIVNQFKTKDIIPNNMILIYSLGGKLDHLIDRGIDRHSKVFENETSLINSGYVNASKDDTKAIGDNKSIGLIYHHPKNYNNSLWGKV